MLSHCFHSAVLTLKCRHPTVRPEKNRKPQPQKKALILLPGLPLVARRGHCNRFSLITDFSDYGNDYATTAIKTTKHAAGKHVNGATSLPLCGNAHKAGKHLKDDLGEERLCCFLTRKGGREHPPSQLTGRRTGTCSSFPH